MHDGVVLIGGKIDSVMSSDGTGFVISRRDRLVATNGHVADIYRLLGGLQVMANGQPTVYEVDQIWYHPGIIRVVNQQLRVASTDASLGETSAACPDVAVLHLAGDAELPAELPLATWDEIKDLFAQPVAMLGFPSYDTNWISQKGGYPRSDLPRGRHQPANGYER